VRAAVKHRSILTLLVTLSCAAGLVSNISEPSDASVGSRTGCWVLPNLRIMPNPLAPHCPLSILDTIRAVEGSGSKVRVRNLEQLSLAFESLTPPFRLELTRRGQVLHESLPPTAARHPRRAAGITAACVLLLAVPLIVLWSSKHPGAFPLCAFYGAFTILFLAAEARSPTSQHSSVALLAASVAPATLFHLGLCFPRERQLLRESPGVIWVPYAGSAFLWILGAFGLYKNASVWPAFLYVLLGVGAIAWLVPAVSCAYALRESSSRLEMARARVFVAGALLLPLLPTVAVAGGWYDTGSLALAYLWGGAAALPLPIALAISRYDLFDLGQDARRWVSAGLFATAGTVTIAGALAFGLSVSGYPIPEPVSLIATSMLCLVALEPVRRYVHPLLGYALNHRSQELIERANDFGRRIHAGSDEDEICALLADFIESSLSPSSVSLFLETSDIDRLAYLRGNARLGEQRMARAVKAALGGSQWLRPSVDGNEGGDDLSAVGAAIAIEHREERIGFVLIESKSQHVFTSLELGCITGAAHQAAAAIVTARRASTQLTVEREAAFGRALVAFAHDTGKDLGWIRRLLNRISAQPENTERVARDAKAAGELSHEINAAIERMLCGLQCQEPMASTATVEALQEEAVRRDTERIESSR
jgi:hypothetical protein